MRKKKFKDNYCNNRKECRGKIKRTPENKIIGSLSTWYERNTTERPQMTHDCAVWRVVTAKACDRHGT